MRFSARPGVTLVEVLLFMALMTIASGALLGFLMMTTDARVRGQASADTAELASQLTQMVMAEIRSSERVLLPVLGEEGSVLVLQGGSAAQSPVILAVESGTLLLVRGSESHALTPPGMTVAGWTVTNASTEEDVPAVAVSFTLEHGVPLPRPETVRLPVDLAASPLPDMLEGGNLCNCAAPACTDGHLTWESCTDAQCTQVVSPAITCQ